MSRAPLADPLGTVLSWVWALGTAAGLAVVGGMAQAEYSSAQTPLAHPALSVDDISPADSAG
ncbi:hypothetical protein J7E97_22145 [Streptomyces sp. ISL-66]|uniref:hypothetical protein n=1 Tax=Streptomyces sp. ISL-66 TaxID=2819186 RepID=UPI001BECE8B9|nr:hypothetical protein [Streptomyces sp. ISL-66]MBT2470501.1 hypothetical protein [Streptomyces sp. ISL-66]